VRRLFTGDGALARSDGDAGSTDRGRGSANAMGVFHRGEGPFIGMGEGRRGGEGGVTAGNAVAFNGQVILGSHDWLR
jgi:hypothetical protein